MMKSSSTTHSFRWRLLKVTPAALALALLALVSAAGLASGNRNRVPDLGDCQELQVPTGNKLAFHAFGEGVQIYAWTGTTWSFVSPEALLFDNPGDHDLVGFHFAGPTWESLSGSKVVGTVAKSCAPNPDTIPWLLVKAVSNEGPGIFQRVSYIQRLYTAGGKAPTDPGEFPGQVARVPYTADYFFYHRAGH
jgi:Protein of unknown function (DUF3455)